MRNSLDRLFSDNQFHRITSNISAITLYVQYRSDEANIVQLLDFHQNYPVNVSEYLFYRENAVEYIKSRGYQKINILTLVLTSYADECRKYVKEDNSVWILDEILERLLVYENQVEDFCGLRQEIENLCVKRSGLKTPGSLKKDKAQAGRRSFISREFTLVNSLLVFTNVLIFILLSIKGSTTDIDYMLEKGVMYVPKIIYNHQYYRFITCFFLHFGFQHLVGNMVVLLFLGDNVDRQLGWVKYLILYFGCGLIGSIGSFTYAYYENQGIVSAGASGAVYGIMGALLWLVIINKGKLENMTIMRICIMIAYALYSGVSSEHIDIAAHISGFIGGFLLALVLYRKEKSNENKHLLWRKRNT